MMIRGFVVLSFCVFFIACTPAPMPDSSIEVVLPDPDSVGAKTLKNYCSECHGMPLPSTHPAEEWSNVVYRMNMHRMKRALIEMTEQEKQDLIIYLQKHAAVK